MNKKTVRVVIDVDVNPDVWVDLYGVKNTEVPADVRRYVMNQMWQSPAADENAVYSVHLRDA